MRFCLGSQKQRRGGGIPSNNEESCRDASEFTVAVKRGFKGRENRKITLITNVATINLIIQQFDLSN